MYTTESGRRYVVDAERGFWTRHAADGSYREHERLWSLQAGTGMSWPWSENPEHVWEKRAPEVGEHLYIASKDVWYVSTPIVRIDEVEGHNLIEKEDKEEDL